MIIIKDIWTLTTSVVIRVTRLETENCRCSQRNNPGSGRNNILPEVAGKAGRSGGAGVAGRDAEHKRQDRHNHQLDAVIHNHVHPAAGLHLVDQVGNDKRMIHSRITSTVTRIGVRIAGFLNSRILRARVFYHIRHSSF